MDAAGYPNLFATGETADNDFVIAMQALPSQLRDAITNGATSVQSVAVAQAQKYLVNSAFRSAFVVNTPASVTPAGVLTALALEMSAGGGNDNKTLTTLAATGLANFLNVVGAATFTWNTEAGPGADYDDSVYVVSAVV